jgi:two-component system NtrC family response regulator/two-component system nitrogen regulation response regulator GlnG
VASRILVVDDDRAMVRTLCDIFRLRGWDAHGVRSGEEAVAAQREGHYPVVLMDIKMSGISGVAAFKQMQAEDPNLRCVLMTAESETSVIEDAERAGAFNVVRKPIDLAALLLLLD